MSYIEFFGTILNIWCVWLVAKNRILNWPVGIIATTLFGILFLQINLYADFFEQIYFFITGFWGWWVWAKAKGLPQSSQKPILRINTRSRPWWVLTIVLGTIILGYLTSNLNIYLPQFFNDPASFPYLDSFTTILSFVATILLVRKELEAWYLWILVDIIGIGLYWAKGVHLISILYCVFLILAIKGLLNWSNIYKSNKSLK
ncbi:MAG: nicotinamide riboside transporter PnuC [Patescibacteria group bacterium]